MSSLLIASCQTITKQYQIPQVTLHSLDVDQEVFFPYEIKGEDKKSCKLRLEPKPKVPYRNPKMQGSVCLTAEQYQKLRSIWKNQCEDSKKY